MQHMTRLRDARRTHIMHMHSRCVKLFKYCVNELGFYLCSQNCGKQLLPSLCLSVRPLPWDGFS